MNIFKVALVSILLLMLPVSASAQDTGEPEDYERRLELAGKMNDLRPARQQVYSAIDQVANSRLPANREAFRTAMRDILNYKAIEKISIDAMAETYTVIELEAMVEYYSKPEAISAAGKEREYSAKVRPEIVRMLDRAIMRVRTGGMGR